MELASMLVFTFQYASIKPLGQQGARGIYKIFTFQYASIKPISL